MLLFSRTVSAVPLFSCCLDHCHLCAAVQLLSCRTVTCAAVQLVSSRTLTAVPLFSWCTVALSLLCRFSAAVQSHCYCCATVQLLSSCTVTAVPLFSCCPVALSLLYHKLSVTFLVMNRIIKAAATVSRILAFFSAHINLCCVTAGVGVGVSLLCVSRPVTILLNTCFKLIRNTFFHSSPLVLLQSQPQSDPI